PSRLKTPWRRSCARSSPARSRLGDGAAAGGGPDALRPLPAGRRAPGRRLRRRARAPALPSRAPPAAAFDEPARAPAQGDQATDPRRRDLPDARLIDADGRDAPGRARRRVAGLRSSLLQPRIDDEG